MSYLDPDIQKILTLELFQFLDTHEWSKNIFDASSRRSESCVAMMVHYFEYLYTNETTHEDMLLMANNSNGGIWGIMLSSDPKHQILTQAPINDSNGNRIGGGFGCDRLQFRDQVLSCFRLNRCFFVPPPKPSPSALHHTQASVTPAAFSVGMNDGGFDANKKKKGPLRKNLKSKTDEKRQEVQGLKKTVSHLERKIISLRQNISNLESRERHLIQSAKLRAAKDKEEKKRALDLCLQNLLVSNNREVTLSTERQLESILALCHPSDFDAVKTDNEVLRRRIFDQLLSTDTSVRLGALITVKLEDDTLQEKKKRQEDSLQFAEKLISRRVEVESEIDRELKICALILRLCASHLKTTECEKEDIEKIDTRVKETVTFLENMKSSYSDFVSHAKLIKFAADDRVFQADITSDTWIQIFSKINQFSSFHLPHRTVQLLKKRVPIAQLDRDVASELGSCLGHLTLSSSSRMSLDVPPDQVSFTPNTDADIMSSAGQDLMSLCGTIDSSRMSYTYEPPSAQSYWNPSSTFLRCRSTHTCRATITEGAPDHNTDGGVNPGRHEFQQIQQQGMISHAPPAQNTNQQLVQQFIPVSQFIPIQQQPAAFSDRQNQSQFGITSDRQHMAQQQGRVTSATCVQNVNQRFVQHQIPAGQFMPPQQQPTVISGTQNQSHLCGTIDGQYMTQQQGMIIHAPSQNTNQHLMQQHIPTGKFMPIFSGSQNQIHSGGASDGHQMTERQGSIPYAFPIENTNQRLVQQQQQLNHYTHHPFQNHQQTHLNHPLQN